MDAHVYPLHLKAITLGVGGQLTLGRAHHAATIDESGRAITAKNVSLKPGLNLLRVKLANEWGSTSISEETSVRYVRPPRILALKAEPPEEGVSAASLEAQVFSPIPLLRNSIKLTVNDMERTAQVEIPNEPAEGNVWTLRLTNVPLEAHALTPSTNKIQLRVSNQEADGKEPAATQVIYTPKQPPPVAEFTRPVNDISVTRPDFKVQFQVRSETELAQVKLLQEKHEPHSRYPRRRNRRFHSHSSSAQGAPRRLPRCAR